MKNKFNFKSIILTLTLLTLGAGQMWATLTEMTDTQVKAVLDNSKVMVYLGCGSGWSGSTSGHMYLNNGSSTTHIIDVTTSRGSSDNDPWFFWKEVTTALSVGSSGTYYLSNSGGWSGQSITASLKAGAAYFMNGSWDDRSGKYSDNIFYITSPSASIPTTAQSVTVGNSISVTTTLTKGYKSLPYSAVHTTMNLIFFAKDGSGKFWEVGKNTSLSSATTPSTTLSGVAELSAGTYTIYAALYDSYGVYIKASNTFTLTVNSASTATITYHENFRTETGNGTGSAPDEEVYALNATATVAGQNTMSWSYYTFSGWNTDEHITGDHYDEDDEFEITENMDLYATWTRSIPMDDQGATTPVSTTVYGTYNSTALTAHTNPAKTGYTFAGWYTQIAGGGNYVISTSHVLQASKTNWTNASGQFIRPSTSTSSLYAKWTQNITLNANTSNHGSGTNKTAAVTYNSTALTSITHCTPATDYELEGYYTDATSGTKILNADGTFAASSITNYITSSKWTKAGATTLYAQYTPIPVKLLYGSSSPLNSPTDGGAMSYDATEQAYYKDVTTNFSPYYFQFQIGSAKYANGTWDTYPNVQEAVANGAKINCADDVSGWDNKASIKFTGANGSSIRIWFDYQNKKAWITEPGYSVTINNGDHGTVSPNGVRSVGASGLTITATPTEGYKLASWNVTGGAHVASLTSATTTLTATADGTVTAIYETEAPIRLYYSNPAGWSPIYAYLWDVDNTSDKNTNWPGTDITTNIEVVDCQQYYYYEYYPSAHAGWDRIIFNGGDGSKQTHDLPFSAATNAGQYQNAGKDGDGSWQDTSNPWYFAYDGDSWSTTAHPLTCTSVTSGYVELDLAANTDYAFKFVENGSTWYGCTEATKITDANQATAQTMNNTADGSADQTIKTAVAGTYRFTWDITNKKVTVTYPTALQIYRSNPNDGTNVGDHQWDTHVGNNFTWGLDLEANTIYEFKINQEGTYYGHNTDITTSFSNRDFATGTNDTKLVTKSAGRFNFTWNSSAHQLTLQYPKSAFIGASPVSVYDEGTTTLTGYASELGSGSHTITYEFYKGTTLTDANKIATKENTVSDTHQSVTQDVTVDFDGNAMSQVYTVQIKEGGVVLATNTVTVYRKWDIYVHDVDSWNAMYYYVYDNASGAHREDWPGLNYSSNKITGSTTWYIVTLDAQYPHFILDNNAGNKQTWGSGVYENDITDFAAGSYWYVDYKETTDGKRYYDLHTIEVTDPTVTLSASIANSKDITLTGTVTDCGGDGMFASDMKDVYFEVAGTKNAATTVSTTAGTFTKTLTNATAGATNTLQAFAENIHGTGSSSILHYTNVTLDRQSGTTGTTAVTAVENMAMPAGATAPGRTGYTFGGYYASTGGSGKQYYNASMGSANNWDQTSKDKTIYAKWTAKSYDVILDVNGGYGDNQTVRATFDAAMPTTLKGGSDPIAARTRTGYNFDGYWANTNGTGTQYYTSALASNHNWDVDNNEQHIYAKWNAKQCTVTFDYQLSAEGHGDAGTLSNVTATYDAAMPALTGNMPTAANGYCFMGFYSGTGGTGTKYYNADKSSANNWAVNTESNTTLYAYYKKAEITEITLNQSIFEPVASGTSYVKAEPTIEPTPVAPTKICWELLYDNDNPVPSGHDAIDDSDGSHPDRVKFSIAGLAAGGYKVRATLHTGDGACGTGTTLSVEEASFTIASDFTVTVQYKCGDATIKSSTTNPGKALEGTSITAPDIIGYTFSKWKAGDGVTIDGADASGEKATATITYTANYNGSLTAIYTRKRMIYFYNTLGWSDVYVYFYKNDSYWDNSGNNWGTGANKDYEYTDHPYSEQKHGTMTQIEGTNIWYFDCEAASIPANYKDVVFTEANQHGYGYFSNTKVSRRGDYNTALPMFVPLADQKVETLNSTAKYYNNGYWMNYPENTGYTLRIYSSWDAATPSREYPFPYSGDLKMPWKVDVEFNFTGQVWFMIYRNDGLSLGKNYTMKQNNHETDLDSGSDQKTEIKTSAPGVYKFTLSFLNVGSVETPSYKHYIYVEYPVGIGDYRIVYKDNATWSQGTAHNASWYHPSDIIPMNSGSEEKADTVSLFVSYGSSPSAKFQKVTAINNETGIVTWGDVASGTVDLSGITAAGVYNFIVSQPAGGASISLTKTEAYSGSYYIRTDNAGNTKWDNYRAADHRMTYTEFSMSAANTTGDKYSHYFASWCERSTNIKFCIANDYSSCISDTLGQDIGNPYKNTDADGWLKSDGAGEPLYDRYSANVRFMYNETTNKISRAYVGSATNAERKFLILEGNDVLKGDDDEAITDWDPRYALILADKQNWIYERTLKIKPGTRFKLYSNYAQQSVDPDSAQYFRGAYESGAWAEDNTKSVILIDGSGGYQMARVLYDFKTNRLMTAWIPSGGAVVGELEINADVLVEREHHEPAQYITFQKDGSGNDGELTGVKTVYGAMKFNRWILNNRQNSSDDDPNHGKTAEQIATHHAPLPVGQQKSIYERSLYFISFPFDVNASDIFGFGHYWDEWYLEYYDGLNRAKNGYWEDSPPNWKYVTPSMLNDFVLKANEGYILGLDLDFMKADNFDFWSNGISTVELFFPSTTTQETLKQTNCTIPALSSDYECKINRGTTEGNRTIKDSYWRCLGVPSFNIYNTSLKDASGTAITWQPDGDALPFIYAWNKADNTLTAQSTSTFTFLPMHAYLVQNGGEIRWTNVSAKPASPIVARRVNEQPEKKYEWRLALTSDSVLIDQTYIKMSNLEQVTDTFDFNQDLIKEFNTYRSDIYTYIGNERVAANSMPLQTEQTTVIPVGVKIKKAGDYTFAMPDGTNGVGVTLIDTETGVRTSLGLMDYTVTLTAGSFNQRFFLEISPVSNVATDIELINDENGDASLNGVRKVLIDNKLFLIKDGEVYDARGAMVK